MPPLRAISACFPSANAWQMTAHSLKACCNMQTPTEPEAPARARLALAGASGSLLTPLLPFHQIVDRRARVLVFIKHPIHFRSDGHGDAHVLGFGVDAASRVYPFSHHRHILENLGKR